VAIGVWEVLFKFVPIVLWNSGPGMPSHSHQFSLQR